MLQTLLPYRGFIRHRERRANSQRGYILMVLMIIVITTLIALTAVAPAIATQIKRDREEELMHRGTQYARAIKRYYKKFGRYPMRIEELENTNNIRFLRKRYKDPITGSDEWRIIHVGEAKIIPKTFGGISTPGNGANLGGTQPSAFGGSSLTPSSMGSSTTGTSPTDTTGAGQSTIGTPASQISQSIGNGQDFGGGPIMGVSSTSKKKSLKLMAGKDHYNEWEFTYDPRFDPTARGFGQFGQGTPGGPPLQPGAPGMSTGVGPSPQPPVAPPVTPH